MGIDNKGGLNFQFDSQGRTKPNEGLVDFQLGRDNVLTQSKYFEVEREDQTGYRMGSKHSSTEGVIEQSSSDFFNFGLRFSYVSGKKDGNNGFVIRSNNELSVLCGEIDPDTGELVEVFKPAPKSEEMTNMSEIELGGKAREGVAAIIRVKVGEEEYFYKFDGSATVWDWPDNANVDATFKLDELKEKRTTDGNNIPPGWKKVG